MPLLYFTATAEALGIARAAEAGAARRRGGRPRAGQPERRRRLRPVERRGERRRLARRLRRPTSCRGRRPRAMPSGPRLRVGARQPRQHRQRLRRLRDGRRGYSPTRSWCSPAEGRAAIGDLRYYADTRADAFATPLAQAQLGAALALSGDQPRADAMFRARRPRGAGGRAGAALPERLRQRRRATPRACSPLAAEAGSDAVDRGGARRRRRRRRATMRSTQEQLWTLLAAHALAGDAAARRARG